MIERCMCGDTDCPSCGSAQGTYRPRKRIPPAAREYLSIIGRVGGQATGKAKVRGDAAYYKRIAGLAAAARARKRKERP
jgi:hypothetical protein